MNFFAPPPALFFLVIATVCEVSGDAFLRTAIYGRVGLTRAGFMLAGAVLLFAYGFTLNLAPLEFGRVAGLYIATLLIVWQVTNFVAFRTLPNLPIVVGGSLIVVGGLIMTCWRPAASI